MTRPEPVPALVTVRLYCGTQRVAMGSRTGGAWLPVSVEGQRSERPAVLGWRPVELDLDRLRAARRQREGARRDRGGDPGRGDRPRQSSAWSESVLRDRPGPAAAQHAAVVGEAGQVERLRARRRVRGPPPSKSAAVSSSTRPARAAAPRSGGRRRSSRGRSTRVAVLSGRPVALGRGHAGRTAPRPASRRDEDRSAGPPRPRPRALEHARCRSATW